MANINKKAATDILRKLKTRAHRLEFDDFDTVSFDKWQRDVEVAINHIFGEKSRNIRDFVDIAYDLEEENSTHSEQNDAFEEGLELAEATIQSMIDEIRQFWPDNEGASSVPAQYHPQNQATVTTKTNRIFIVHGHDDTMKEPVARVVTQLGLEPVILHEQPNRGRTIIEKFTDYSDVSFAIVLLSPDDRGYAKGTSNSQAKLRARQNVVFELGYFLGKLGRQRVLALYRSDPNFEMPSDYSGVAYTLFDDADAWRIRLVKELRLCGFTVDANKLM